MLSAILYCIYVNGLFSKLREKKTGCWIGGDFLGILGYADDNFLLCPSYEGLQEMLKTCEDYTSEHNLAFSTNPIPDKSKTKYMAYLFKERKLVDLVLCGNPLPWVESGKHLGNIITNKKEGMNVDLMKKRATFIDRNAELCQEFPFAHPRTKVFLNRTFNTHFTGSQLWNLFGKEAKMLENSWNISIRKMFDLPREAHRYLIEPLSETQHIKSVLMKRFLSFCQQIKQSSKNALRNVFTAYIKTHNQ